jgi:outer membrane murein-binding lipoprotein Lpp
MKAIYRDEYKWNDGEIIPKQSRNHKRDYFIPLIGDFYQNLCETILNFYIPSKSAKTNIKINLSEFFESANFKEIVPNYKSWSENNIIELLLSYKIYYEDLFLFRKRYHFFNQRIKKGKSTIQKEKLTSYESEDDDKSNNDFSAESMESLVKEKLGCNCVSSDVMGKHHAKVKHKNRIFKEFCKKMIKGYKEDKPNSRKGSNETLASDGLIISNSDSSYSELSKSETSESGEGSKINKIAGEIWKHEIDMLYLAKPLELYNTLGALEAKYLVKFPLFNNKDFLCYVNEMQINPEAKTSNTDYTEPIQLLVEVCNNIDQLYYKLERMMVVNRLVQILKRLSLKTFDIQSEFCSRYGINLSKPIIYLIICNSSDSTFNHLFVVKDVQNKSYVTKMNEEYLKLLKDIIDEEGSEEFLPAFICYVSDTTLSNYVTEVVNFTGLKQDFQDKKNENLELKKQIGLANLERAQMGEQLKQLNEQIDRINEDRSQMREQIDRINEDRSQMREQMDRINEDRLRQNQVYFILKFRIALLSEKLEHMMKLG